MSPYFFLDLQYTYSNIYIYINHHPSLYIQLIIIIPFPILNILPYPNTLPIIHSLIPSIFYIPLCLLFLITPQISYCILIIYPPIHRIPNFLINFPNIIIISILINLNIVGNIKANLFG